MKDDEVKNFADKVRTSKVYLKSGGMLDGHLSTAGDGIYNVTQTPSKSGVIEGGLFGPRGLKARRNLDRAAPDSH